MSIPLSETSALVLVCDRGISYQSPKARQFLSHLDLSKGHRMYNKIKELSPYIDEVIPNRKWIIHNYIREVIKKNNTPIQTLILACGWDPVMIKMSEEFPTHFFFGVDSEELGLSSRLTTNLLPQSHIYYLRANLTQPESLLLNLLAKGWKSQVPTCLVVEGITYYIPKKPLWHTLKTLKNNTRSKLYICGDFLVNGEKEKLSDTGIKLGRTIFDMIKESCALEDYYSYTRQEIIDQLKMLDFTDICFFNQDEIQTKRTGKNKVWEKSDSYIQLFTTQ